METFLLWILIGVAVVSAVCLLPFLPYIIYAPVRLMAESVTNLQDIFSTGLDDISEERSLKQLQRDMQKRIQNHMAAKGFRRAFRAGKDEIETYAATALLKEAVGGCCDLHHHTAYVRNVTHMRELENHFICGAHRTRVLDTLEFVLDRLAQKDLAGNITQSKMAVGVEAMHDICANCMLLRFARTEAPRLCDPAKYMGCAENVSESGPEGQ